MPLLYAIYLHSIVQQTYLFYFIYFLKVLFIFRERGGREKKKERNMDV